MERASSEPLANIGAAFSDGKSGDRVADVRSLERPLVERARRGDREAYGELYRLHHAAVFRLARFRLGGEQAAEDAAAETFARAWAALPRYRFTGAPFSAWLYAIARNVSADEQRRRGRVEPRGTLPETSETPQHEDRLALAAAVAKLPKGQRAVVEMKFVLGLTNAEVATALGRSPGAVNAMQWRALRTLRRRLG